MGRTKPYTVNIEVEAKSIPMELDTGASLTLVSEETYRSHWSDKLLRETKTELYTYSGESISVLGTIDVLVRYGGQESSLPLLVVSGDGPILLGRNWLEKIKLNWYNIFWLHNATLSELLDKYKRVFGSDLGTAKGFKAKIIVETNATPKFLRARSIQYFNREKVEVESLWLRVYLHRWNTLSGLLQL